MSERDTPLVLALNAGSSTLKGAAFRAGVELDRRSVELDGTDAAALAGPVDDLLDALLRATDAADPGGARGGARGGGGDRRAGGDRGPDVVGHRIVHGGPRHAGPALVDDALLAELEDLVPLAPLHQPGGLAVVAAARRRFPDVIHVASFDTAFHHRLPPVAQRLAVPDAWHRARVRRYGFHGLSYEHLVDELDLGEGSGRVVLAHLGAGASLAAVIDGRPVDTTMGLTPTGGLVMATRSGDLDPGVVAWALRSGVPADEVGALLDHHAGLLGLAGTADLRELLDRRDRARSAAGHRDAVDDGGVVPGVAADDEAALAVAVFGHALRKHVGAMAAALGGMDALVFTGGIGERSAAVRAELAAGLAHLGVELDPAANETGRPIISAPASRCVVRVVPADEERPIATQAQGLAVRAQAR